MKDKLTAEMAWRALEPVARFCHQNKRRGAAKEILERLEKRTKKKLHKASFGKWIHPDPKRRGQPLLGIGLLIIEIGSKVMAEWETDKCADQSK